MPSDYSAGGQRSGYVAPSTVSDFDKTSADIPIWGWLSGASGRRDAARQQDAANINRSYWDTLRAPTADQLMGSQESQQAQGQALSQLQQWGRGGLTQADRSGLEGVRQRDALASRGQQQALQQSAQARGVGGGGLDFATRQQASQMGQQQASDAEAQMLQGAQQRALAAVQAQGSLASSMRSQDSSAVQGAYQDAASRAAGATGQYSTDTSARAATGQRQDQQSQAAASGIGGLIDQIL